MRTEILRYICKASILFIIFLTVGCSNSNSDGPKVSYGPYQNLYLSSFKKLPEPNKSSIEEAGHHRLYPEPLENVWKGCLLVISQYDAVAYLSGESKIAVFSQGVQIQSNKSGQDSHYYDTFIAVSLQDRGPEHTAVYVAWLPPENLKPTAIPTLSKDFDWDNLAEVDGRTARKWITAIIAEEFYNQLSTQLFYKSRWQDKFQF